MVLSNVDSATEISAAVLFLRHVETLHPLTRRAPMIASLIQTGTHSGLELSRPLGLYW